ncbi:Hypothetical predicted protein [Marmota monax]|uniref:Uncharacterized protein n=1 Tax=Marmota monax TaxID=9995 RepID=A0A5E4A7C3_MARMO|nr:hypothetical protein GHT09_019039 [Marmota monax]VTJ53163.1 Hypothetical predicted protein [Marmota monax]
MSGTQPLGPTGIPGFPVLSGKPELECAIPREGAPSSAGEREGWRKGPRQRPSLEEKELPANEEPADCTLTCWAGTAQGPQDCRLPKGC